MYASINPILQHAIERVGRPGGSHEDVGRKKRDLGTTLKTSLEASSAGLLAPEPWQTKTGQGAPQGFF